MKLVLVFISFLSLFCLTTRERFVFGQSQASDYQARCFVPPLGDYREITPKLLALGYKDKKWVVDDSNTLDPHFRFSLQPLGQNRELWEKKHCRGELRLKGRFIDSEGSVYRFSRAIFLKEDRKLIFVTRETKNVRYEFDGQFYDGLQIDGEMYLIHLLRGTLRIYTRNELSMEKTLKFTDL